MNAIPYDGLRRSGTAIRTGPRNRSSRSPGVLAGSGSTARARRCSRSLLGAIGFYAGVRVEKSQVSNSSSTTGALGAAAARQRCAPRRLAVAAHR